MAVESTPLTAVLLIAAAKERGIKVALPSGRVLSLMLMPFTGKFCLRGGPTGARWLSADPEVTDAKALAARWAEYQRLAIDAEPRQTCAAGSMCAGCADPHCLKRTT